MCAKMDHHTKDVSMPIHLHRSFFAFVFVEALVYQKIGLYKGDQYYHLGTILADKFAKGSGDVS